MAATASRKVPFAHKVAFGLGMLANQMFPAALGIFMVVLVQDMGFPTWMWGILFFLPRAYDAVLDPIMGFISDNTRSRWGRRRQYVFIGAIMLGVGFVAMWQLHRSDGLTYHFFYFHPWELDDQEQPPEGLGATLRFRAYVGRGRMRRDLPRLLRRFGSLRIDDTLRRLGYQPPVSAARPLR